MKIQTVAQLLTISSGAKERKEARQLCASAQTDEEKAAVAAYRRIKTGAVVLVVVLTLIMMAIMAWAITTMDPVGRTGTVQSDGQIRYIQNTAKFVSQEELNLQMWDLQPGDKVYIYTDSVTDEITGGMPCAVADYKSDVRGKVVLGYLIFMVVVLLVYSMVICRFTPFGSPWHQYRLKLKEKEREEIPPRVNFAINVIALVIALLLCWPQIAGIIENIRKLNEIGAMTELINSSREEAEDVIDALGNMEIANPDALTDAENAAQRIKDILNSGE